MSEWAQRHTPRTGEGGITSFGREPVGWGEPQEKSSVQRAAKQKAERLLKMNLHCLRLKALFA